VIYSLMTIPLEKELTVEEAANSVAETVHTESKMLIIFLRQKRKQKIHGRGILTKGIGGVLRLQNKIMVLWTQSRCAGHEGPFKRGFEEHQA
jgi:hypothetical protein